MVAATLTEKGQIVIPAEIRARYELTPGTQLQFVDEGGAIRLIVLRRVPRTDPAAGYSLIKIKRSAAPSADAFPTSTPQRLWRDVGRVKNALS